MRRGMLKEHSSLFFILVCLVELVLVASSGFLGHWFELGSLSYDTNMDSIEAILLGVILAAIVFPLCRVYAPLRGQTIGTVFSRILCAWGLVICYLVLIAFFTHRTGVYSRGFLLSWAVIGVVLLLAFRLLLVIFLRYLRSHEHNLRRVVVIGAGSLGERIVRNLKQRLWTGYRVIGFLDDDEQKVGKSIRRHRVYKTPKDLEQWLADHAVDEVWLALPLHADQRMKELLYDMRHNALTIRLVPDIFCFSLLNHSQQNIAGLPTLNLKSSPVQGINRLLKAIEDRVLAMIILAMISPIMFLLAILVKLSSKGPIFFKQERVTLSGKRFNILKFRSMPVSAESKTGAVWATQGENRATKIGALMRKTSLDELPQFINVLKGDMSIVGPRPERPVFIKKFKHEIPDYMQKHLVKAGITGWAQVNGWRGDTDLGKRIEHDIDYIENWSLWLDIKIIFKTILNGFIHKNAY
ncbi:undecaprenyl-phosphate glucose phosphotransferase [Piscirickettsia salmonis]|uniref:undecaprenyl-phosphate glucose phosphotransferase n=1 Tax=Piscirickettsia salmonis TaxID=1238 RepID=UPI003EBE96AF